MADVVIYTEGDRTYRIMGLKAKAQAIAGASSEMDTLISDRVQGASSALAQWRGRHATHFGEDVNGVLSKMAGLKVSLTHAANVLSAFPDQPYGESYGADAVYNGARVQFPTDPATASAVPAHLRAYSTTSNGQDGRFATLAAIVNLDGVTATVSYQRSLNASERQSRIDEGIPPDLVDQDTVNQTDTANVSRLISLPSPSPDVPPLVTESRAASEFASAVAIAFQNADQRLLDLLATYPDLAGFIVEGMADGRVSGESSLAILLAYFSTFDIAAHGGNGDGRVSRSDLEAILNRNDLPGYVRAAAQYLLDNRVLFGLAETVGNGRNDPLGRFGDGEISQEDIRSFLELNANLRVVQHNFDAFDVAAHGGDGDGRVSINDLEAIAAGSGPMAAAAQYLLDHDDQRLRLAYYEQAKQSGGASAFGYNGNLITRNSVIGLTVDQQIYGDDPEAAHRFVRGLPVPSGGDRGIPIWLCSDEGTRNLANAALIDTNTDLSETHEVISHLPETTGAVRNRLITGYYDLLARRADALFAGGDLAGRPGVNGHPGANWLLFAPWASDGVHDVITGDFSVFGINPGMTDRQAAADGNQWIFDDIGSRYADFIEMYERNPNPSEAELEYFFGSSNFGDGDNHLRTGFSAYVAAMEETDPVRRQRLLFEGNSLVAMHEQAGVQPYLEELSTGPDNITVRYIDIHLGPGPHLDVDRDVPVTNRSNNSIVDANILDLDPGGKTPANYGAYAPGSTTFSVGGTSRTGVVDMDPITGIESFDEDFPTNTHHWAEHGGEVQRTRVVGRYPVTETVHPDPDGQEGTGANSWPDRSERMWYILKLFEQHHTDPALYQTNEMNLNLDDIDWLDPATGLR